MKKLVSTLTLAGLTVIASSQSMAATFTPDFSDFSFPGNGRFDVNDAANEFFTTNYGITIDNAYLYRGDPRDTFDGIGIANGFAANVNVPNQTGRVNFLDTTNFVDLDIVTINSSVFSAFNESGTIISSITKAGGINEMISFQGGESIISFITFTSEGGFAGISGLTYNYDGVTGGGNTDIDPDLNQVPVPAALPLMASALSLLGFGFKRGKVNT